MAEKADPEKTRRLAEEMEKRSQSASDTPKEKVKNQKPRRTGADGLFSDSVGKSLFGMSLLALVIGGVSLVMRKKL